MSAPSSSRMLRSMRWAMNSRTSPGTASRSWAAFLRKIAIRVSSSGGWMSVIRPHSNRVRIRSARVSRRFGGRSEETTICLFELCSVLKVWKNSSCALLALQELDVVDEQDVDVAVAALKATLRSSRRELMKSLVNSSVDT